MRNDGIRDLGIEGEGERSGDSIGCSESGFDCTGSGGRVSIEKLDDRRLLTFSDVGNGVVILSTCRKELAVGDGRSFGGG